MNFSDKTFESLSKYERYFNTAVNGDWCSNPGRSALMLMHDAQKEAEGKANRADFNCGPCLLTLVKRVGSLWIADKEERSRMKMEKVVKAVSTTKKKTTKTTKAKKS